MPESGTALKSYSFGTPGWQIWLFHIILGLILMSFGVFLVLELGSELEPGSEINREQEIEIERGRKAIGTILLMIGFLAIAFHLHTWSLKKK